MRSFAAATTLKPLVEPVPDHPTGGSRMGDKVTTDRPFAGNADGQEHLRDCSKPHVAAVIEACPPERL